MTAVPAILRSTLLRPLAEPSDFYSENPDTPDTTYSFQSDHPTGPRATMQADPTHLHAPILDVAMLMSTDDEMLDSDTDLRRDDDFDIDLDQDAYSVDGGDLAMDDDMAAYGQQQDHSVEIDNDDIMLDEEPIEEYTMHIFSHAQTALAPVPDIQLQVMTEAAHVDEQNHNQHDSSIEQQDQEQHQHVQQQEHHAQQQEQHQQEQNYEQHQYEQHQYEQHQHEQHQHEQHQHEQEQHAHQQQQHEAQQNQQLKAQQSAEAQQLFQHNDTATMYDTKQQTREPELLSDSVAPAAPVTDASADAKRVDNEKTGAESANVQSENDRNMLVLQPEQTVDTREHQNVTVEEPSPLSPLHNDAQTHLTSVPAPAPEQEDNEGSQSSSATLSHEVFGNSPTADNSREPETAYEYSHPESAPGVESYDSSYQYPIIVQYEQNRLTLFPPMADWTVNPVLAEIYSEVP